MRFVCEQCQTRYTIPDDKARGRALKVRCKKCDNVIIIKPVAAVEAEPQAPEPSVAEPQGSGDAGDATMVASPEDVARLRAEVRKSMAPAEAAPPAAPAAGDDVEWFVIVSGQQEGPMSKAGLIDQIKAGSLTARNYVWSEELPDWKRLEDVPSLAIWLAKQTEQAGGASKPLTPGATVKQRSAPAAKKGKPESGPDIQAMLDEVPLGDTGEAKTVGAEEVDPFAAVPDSPDLVQAGPGEMTQFVIAQSGIEKHRSPLRIALFVGGALAVVGGGVFALSRLGVTLPGVLHPHPKTDEKIYSDNASKDAALRNELLGVHKAPTQARSGGAQVAVSHTAPQKDLGPLAHKDAQHVDQLDDAKRRQLKDIYAKGTNDPTLKVSVPGQAPAIDRPDAPLSAQQVASTVAHFQSGYGRCVDLELKRNPGFHGGKIRIVTTIMSSGLVRQAEIQSDDAALARRLTGSPLGGCLVDNTRRMVFPNFSGDPFDAEIPLVLSSSM